MLIIFFIFNLFFPKTSLAQGQEYFKYQENYQVFIEKTNVNNTYHSISTQKELFEITKKTLNTRELALKSYLNSLRSRLPQFQSANPSDTQKLIDQLLILENWLDQKAQSALTLNSQSDLQNYALDFNTKYLEIQQIAYSSLVQHEVNQKTLVLNELDTLTQIMKTSPTIKNQDWLPDIEATSSQIKSKLAESLLETSSPQYNHQEFNSFYQDSKEYLNEAQQLLTKMFSNLTIILIKSKS